MQSKILNTFGYFIRTPFVPKMLSTILFMSVKKEKYFSWVFSYWLAGITIQIALLRFSEAMPLGMFVYDLKMFQTTLKMSCLCLEGEDGYLHSTTKFIWANSHLIYLRSLPHLINWILPVVILLGRQLRHNI